MKNVQIKKKMHARPFFSGDGIHFELEILHTEHNKIPTRGCRVFSKRHRCLKHKNQLQLLMYAYRHATPHDIVTLTENYLHANVKLT